MYVGEETFQAMGADCAKAPGQIRPFSFLVKVLQSYNLLIVPFHIEELEEMGWPGHV